MICLNIKPINDERLTCFERPLCVLANWLKREYEPMFIGCFSFSHNYVKSYNSIYDSLDMLLLMNTYSKMAGIDVTIHQLDAFHHFLSTIHDNLSNGYPIMTFIDSFWCPWYPSYKTSHIKHYVLIIGIDVSQKHVFCLDRYNEDDYIRVLPFDDLKSGRGEYLTFSSQMLFSLSSTDYLHQLHKNLIFVCSEHYNIWKNIDLFKTSFGAEFDIIAEIENVHTYKVASIYTWLKGVSNSRSKLKDSLIWFNRTYYAYFPEDILMMLNTAQKKWWKIVLLLIKSISSNSKKEYIYVQNTLDQIITLEREIYSRLLVLTNEKEYL